MKGLFETRSAFPLARRPGGTLLICGVILFGMGAYVLQWDLQQIEGPDVGSLIRVEATLIEAHCKTKRSSSYGAAKSSAYGVPVVLFEYQYQGQIYRSDRYFRQWNTGLGYPAECAATLNARLQTRAVDAWVDPGQPSFAVLSKELQSQFLHGAFMALGAGLAMLGSYRLWAARRRPSRRARTVC